VASFACSFHALSSYLRHRPPPLPSYGLTRLCTAALQAGHPGAEEEYARPTEFGGWGFCEKFCKMGPTGPDGWEDDISRHLTRKFLRAFWNGFFVVTSEFRSCLFTVRNLYSLAWISAVKHIWIPIYEQFEVRCIFPKNYYHLTKNKNKWLQNCSTRQPNKIAKTPADLNGSIIRLQGVCMYIQKRSQCIPKMRWNSDLLKFLSYLVRGFWDASF
jgi:hypothetical protein